MEATKSTRKTTKRKPFTDLSNTIPSSLPSSLLSSSSSSSSIKPQAKSSHSLPLKSLLNNNPNSDLTSKPTFTETESNDNVTNVNKNNKENVKGPSNKEIPSSILSPPPKTPSVSGIGDSLASELSTVYKRRPTADKMKSKQKKVVEPLSCSLETRMPDLRKKRYGDDDIGLSKSCPMPCKKKQHREKAKVNASEHDLPQDFIDKQRAYFAEIDAFELEEEEVASDDELETWNK